MISANLLKVWDAEYPWDIRVEKVARALTEAGFAVHLASRNRRCEVTIQQLPEATVHRMPCWRPLPKALRDALMFPAPVNPRWLAFLWSLARRVQPRVLLCRDLPLAVPSWIVARRMGLPIVLDMAEHYPAMLRSRWTAGRTRPLDVLARNPRMAAAVERWIIPKVDHVIAVVEESRARFVELGAAPDRVSVVSNTPLRANVRPPRAPAAAPIRVAYLGLIEEQRGIGTLIRSASLLKSRGIAFELAVIGDGKEYDEFRALARREGLDAPQITFHGHLENQVAQEVLRQAHIGVIPHYADESWNFTIPNKLFDYMAAGLAVVTSDAIPAARVCRETGTGRVFRSQSTESLAEELASLIGSPSEIDRCSSAGRRWILERYNWEHDTVELVRVMRETITSRAGLTSSHHYLA